MEQEELSIAAFDAAIQDELMVHGDPRGELMALQERQARGEATPQIDRRVSQLISKHKRELLGPLAKVLDDVSYERGEPVRARLMARPKTLFETLEDRRWQTLRTLDVAPCGWVELIGNRRAEKPSRLGELITHCRSLNELRGLTLRAFPERGCDRVVKAEVYGVGLDRVFETFPSLRELTWKSEHELPWVHSRTEQLDSLTLGTRYDRGITWSAGVITLASQPDAYDVAFVATCPKLLRLEVDEDMLGYPNDMSRLTDCFRVAREHGAPVVLIARPSEDVGPVWY